LHALASMGHGDAIAIVDANFPSASVGKRVIAIAARARTRCWPRCSTCCRSTRSPRPRPSRWRSSARPTRSPSRRRLRGGDGGHDLADIEIGQLERQAFYDRARDAYAVVRTGELRPYGNILLVKGTVHNA
jgi:L-fucose mutarotase